MKTSSFGFLRAITILCVIATSTVARGADDDEDDVDFAPETSLDAAVEAKRIESLAMPPTQFEIGEDLKEAKKQKQLAERRSKALATRLEELEKTAKSVAAARDNIKSTQESLVALRKEIDAQISANKADPEKLKGIVANLKPVVDSVGYLERLTQVGLLERNAAPTDKEIVKFALGLSPKMTEPRSMPDGEFLVALKEFRAKFPTDESIAKIPEALQRAVENTKRSLIEAQKSTSTIADAWTKRYSALSEQLRKLQSATVSTVVASLPYLMGILALFGVAAIFLVRFFPEAVQVEWVASGQVIQLLTVVTLLLIILCLALTSIIKEETIGTLLGGIGGYVLSQGIGRAAGRAAARAATTTG